jgi:hypothetical protein
MAAMPFATVCLKSPLEKYPKLSMNAAPNPNNWANNAKLLFRAGRLSELKRGTVVVLGVLDAGAAPTSCAGRKRGAMGNELFGRGSDNVLTYSLIPQNDAWLNNRRPCSIDGGNAAHL